MSLDYIRTFYGVPAKRGARVRFLGSQIVREGVIVGADHHLRVRFDGERRTHRLHPTWRVEYLTTEATS